MEKSYSDIRQDADAHRETNDCTVVAVSVACGIEYAEAHALLAAAGRKRGKGFSDWKYLPLIEQQGNAINRIRPSATAMPPAPLSQLPELKAKTVRTVEKELAANYSGLRVLIRTSGHVLAWNGKEIVDWTAGRNHRIIAAYVIFPAGTMPKPSAPVAPKERKALRRSSDQNARHGCLVYFGDNLIGSYKSVAAAYKDNGWSLRGHQRVRRLMKLYGEATVRLPNGSIAKFTLQP